jgi:uncharacterized protein (DUF488 family)
VNTLYTIGHSNHDIGQFIALLSAHGVSAVADVRSSPHSEFVPQFNKETLEQALRDADIEYVFLGKELGARRAEASCYVDGQAKYERVKDLALFRTGLKRIFEGLEHYVPALTCAEADPITCHRTILICREIKRVRPDLNMAHILSDGALETHEEAEQRLILLHKLQLELFGPMSSMDGVLAKAYEMQGERIAYRKGPGET